MSAHELPRNFLIASWAITDPGSSGTFDLSSNGRVYCAVKTAGAESRTVGAPEKVGQQLHIFYDTSGGNLTVSSSYGQGWSSLVISSAGDYLTLTCISVAGVLKWRLMGAGGLVSGSTTDFAADSLTVGSAIVSPYEKIEISLAANSNCIDQNIFIADRAYQVTRVDYSHATAGTDVSAVNLQLAKQTGTQAIGSGVNLLTNNTNAGFDCKGAINTVQNGTLTATTANLQLAAGNRLALDFTGTITSLAGVLVTVQLKPI